MGQEVFRQKLNKHMSGSKGVIMKKRISDRKKKANRQNALRSTGPKTAQGKKKIGRNALKHGFFSKEVFINKGDGRESKAEYNRLHEFVIADLKPEGALEEMMVDLIFSHMWRLRRALRCETGALRLRLDTAEIDQEIEKADSDQWQLMLMPTYMFKKNKLSLSSYGVHYLIELLDRAQKELTENGFVTEKIHDKLEKYFGKSEGTIGDMCSRFVKHQIMDKILAAEQSNSSECPSNNNEEKKQLLDAISLERNHLIEHLVGRQAL